MYLTSRTSNGGGSRNIMYYLFLNYNYYLECEKMQESRKAKLSAAVKTLPEYLSSKITIK